MPVGAELVDDLTADAAGGAEDGHIHGRGLLFRVVLGASRQLTGRSGPRGLPGRGGSAGDEDLAEGAVGEECEGLVGAVERDAGFDVDSEGACGDVGQELCELVGGGGGHDAGEGDVVAAELLGGGAERGGQGAAGADDLADGGGVTGGVQGLVDPVGACSRTAVATSPV